MEAELRESEALQSEIATVAEIGVARFDLEGRRTFVNDTLVRRTGMSRDQLLKGSLGDRNLQEDRERARQLFSQCVATQKPMSGIMERFEARGRLSYVRTSMAPLFGPKGEVIGVQVTSLDITELMEAQERLRESDAFHRGVVALADVAVARFDVEGRRVLADEALTRHHRIRPRWYSPERTATGWRFGSDCSFHYAMGQRVHATWRRALSCPSRPSAPTCAVTQTCSTTRTQPGPAVGGACPTEAAGWDPRPPR
ncbi:MAG: PAS domain-containing protein [Chloroflexota bacterium]|nr:PAS domain-containing protein [Chloroflexota bacterium]